MNYSTSFGNGKPLLCVSANDVDIITSEISFMSRGATNNYINETFIAVSFCDTKYQEQFVHYAKLAIDNGAFNNVLSKGRIKITATKPVNIELASFLHFKMFLCFFCVCVFFYHFSHTLLSSSTVW